MGFKYIDTLTIQAANDIADYLVNPIHPYKRYGRDYQEHIKQAGAEYHNGFLAAVRQDYPNCEADIQYTEINGGKVSYGYRDEPTRYIDAHISIKKLSL